jgi:hypothetical protein
MFTVIKVNADIVLSNFTPIFESKVTTMLKLKCKLKERCDFKINCDIKNFHNAKTNAVTNPVLRLARCFLHRMFRKRTLHYKLLMTSYLISLKRRLFLYFTIDTKC